MQPHAEADAVHLVGFHRAMAEHADGLKSFAARMLRDPQLAEDIAQDAFLALYRHLNQVPASAYRPWLYRVTRNLCLDVLRRRKFKLKLFRDVGNDDTEDFTPRDDRGLRPEVAMQNRETQQAIEEAIQSLPVKFREAFLLCEVQGLSYEDAAAVMKCPVKTVSTRLFRARQRFKAALSGVIEV
jgi:RNA polymerase sigma-70 factor (ECF subfamily)